MGKVKVESRDEKLNLETEVYADQILLTCGSESTLVIGRQAESLAYALRSRGVNAISFIPNTADRDDSITLFGTGQFRTIVFANSLENFSEANVGRLLDDAYRICTSYLFLIIHTKKNDVINQNQVLKKNRAWWETYAFQKNFRKHFLYYRINRYDLLEQDGEEIVVPLEKIPDIAVARYPLSALRLERDLHMDMLRETGSRSDAHVDRYAWASRYVRPGDTVIDAACGLGYGTYVLASTTRGKRFIGIDGSNYAADYARANFGEKEGTEFYEGYLPHYLEEFPSASVDVVISFETLEHVEDPIALLREVYRVLTPGGRLICSVPNDWSDETGEDPNPYHLHVYTQQKLSKELKAFFDVEQLIGQSANRAKRLGAQCEWEDKPREYVSIKDESESIEAEWILAVAAKGPYVEPEVPYVEKVFTTSEQEISGHALAFDRDYENPWLIRTIVSIGLRTNNPQVREKWARQALEHSSQQSADYGAALCVLAYLEYEKTLPAHNSLIFIAADRYIMQNEEINPSILRWKISLAYVLALYHIKIGKITPAKEFLQRVLSWPAHSYSSTLLTKPAQAGFLLGALYLSEGKPEYAKRVWLDTLNKIQPLISQSLASPYAALPASFELPEITSAMTTLTKIVEAIRNHKYAGNQPSLYYDTVITGFQLDGQKVEVTHELSQLRIYIDQLAESKKWLVEQLQASDSALEARDAEIKQLVVGKDWLEEQWKNLTQANQQQAEEVKRCADELIAIKCSSVYRLLSRIGLL